MSGFGLSALGKLCLLLLFSCDEVFTVAEVVKEALRARVGLKHPPCVGCLLPDLLNDPYGSVVPLGCVARWSHLHFSACQLSCRGH